MGLGNLAIRGSLWTLFQVLSERVVQTLVFLIAARILGPTDFGKAAMALVPATMLSAGIQGISQAVTRQTTHEDEASRSSAFWFSSLLGLVFSLAVVVSAPLIAFASDAPDIRNLIYLSGVTPFLTSLGVVSEGILIREFRFKVLVIRRSLGILLGGVGCIYLAYSGYGALSLIVQSIVIAAVTAIVCLLGERRGIMSAISRHGIVAQFTCSKYLIVNSIVCQGNIRLGEMVVGAVAGPAAAAMFRIARTLMDVVTSVIYNPVLSMLLPIFARMNGDKLRVCNAYSAIVSVSLVILSVPLIAQPLVSGLFVQAVFGDKWDGLSSVISVFALIYPTMAFTGPAQSFFIANGMPGLNLASNAVQTFANILFLGAGSAFGPLAAAGALAARAILSALGVAWLVVRVTSGFRFGKGFLRPIIISSLISLSVWAMFFFAVELPTIPVVLVLVTSSIVLYFCLVSIFCSDIVRPVIEAVPLAAGVKDGLMKFFK